MDNCRNHAVFTSEEEEKRCFTRDRIFREDLRTGEVQELSLEEYYIVNKTEAERAKCAKQERMNRIAQRSSRSEMPFVWSIHGVSEPLLPKMPVGYIAMLFYLATFCGYSGFLTTGKKPIDRKRLPEVLQVSKITAYRFWKSVEKLNVGKEDEEGRLWLSEDYFRRGKVPRKEMGILAEKGCYVMRAYVKSIQSLYEKADPASRKTLGYLFRMLPYLNRQYNVACHNPLEEEEDEIRTMNLGEICDAIGYGRENATRLLKKFHVLKCMVLQQEQSVIGCMEDKSTGNRKSYQLFLNPDLCYAGSNWDVVKMMGKF